MGFFKNLIRNLVVSYIGEAYGAGYNGDGVALAHKNSTPAVGILSKSNKEDFIFNKEDIVSVRTDERNAIITVQGKRLYGNKYTVNFKNGNQLSLHVKSDYCRQFENVFN